MTKINYKKLLNSKWTSVNPINKEKHFIVTKVLKNLNDSQVIDFVLIEAVFTKRVSKVLPISLSNRELWIEGWK